MDVSLVTTPDLDALDRSNVMAMQSMNLSLNLSGTTDPGQTTQGFTRPQWYTIRGCTVLVITLGIITSNVVNLKIWCRNTRMPWATRHFLINLSSCDLLVGLVATSSAIYPAFTGHWPFGAVWCQVSGVTHSMSVTLSIWSIAMVGIDRYIAVARPHVYKRFMSKSHGRWLIAGMWLAAAVTFTAPLLTKHNFIYYKYSQEESICGLYWEYPAYCIITSVYIPLLSAMVLVFTSCKIHRSLSITRAHNRQPYHKQRMKTNRRALNILKATSICFFLNWGPYVVLTEWRMFDASFRLPGWVTFCVLWTANANSMVNVFIYSFTNKHFQKEAKIMCHFLSRRKKISPDTSSDDNEEQIGHDDAKQTSGPTNQQSLLNVVSANDSTLLMPRDVNSVSRAELSQSVRSSTPNGQNIINIQDTCV